MVTLRANILKVVILVSLVALSLIFNQNGVFWSSVENKYFSLFFLLLFSCILFILPVRQIKLNKIDIVVIALLLLCTASRISRLGALNEIQVITSIALILYYLSVKTVNFKSKELSVYNAGIVFVTVALTVFSILEFYQVILPTNFNWTMTGNFSNPGPLGGFLAIILPLLFLELLRNDLRKLVKFLYVLVACIMVFTIVLSGSRTAMLSVIVSVTIIVGYYGLKKWKYFKYALFLLLPILAFVIFSKGLDSISGRFLIWKITFKSFFEKPILGIGYGFFKVDYLNFQAKYFSLGGTEREVLLAGANQLAFNEPLKFVVENGLLGVGLVIIGVAWILKSNKSSLSIFKNINKKSLQAFIFYGAFIAFSMFSYPLQFLPFKLVLINQLAFQRGLPVFFCIKSNKITTPLLILSLSFIFYLASYQYEGVRAWKRGRELQFKNPDSTSVLYDLAKHRLKYDGGFLMQYGVFEEKKNNQNGLKLYEAVSQTYNVPFLYLKRSRLYESFQDFNAAEKNLKKQHFMQPHLFKPQEQLLNFYIRRHDTIKVKHCANKILKTPIKVESQEVFRIKSKATTCLLFFQQKK